MTASSGALSRPPSEPASPQPVPRFGRILVGLKPELPVRALAEAAAALATSSDALVHLMRIGEVAGGADAVDCVEQARAFLDDRHVSCAAGLARPRAADEIVRYVIETGQDLLMTAVQVRPGAGGVSLDAFDRRLLRTCPCPVWLVNAGAPRPLGRLLVAIDPFEHERHLQRLAPKLLATATSLATELRLELHVVHAWSLFGEHLLRSRVDARELDVWGQAAEHQASQAVTETLVACGVDLARHRVHLVKGTPAEAIASLAYWLQIDLLVIGTMGRASTLAGLIIQPYVEAILRRVRCGVLAVKPDGFRPRT